MNLKMLFAEWRPFCPGLNVLPFDIYMVNLNFPVAPFTNMV